MKKHALLAPILLAAAVLVAGAQKKSFTVVETTIPEMQKAMKEKRVTSRELVQQYLTRIAMYDDKLHATVTVNPSALKEAEELDRERARGKVRGPLHGIPIALKEVPRASLARAAAGAAHLPTPPPTRIVLNHRPRDRRLCQPRHLPPVPVRERAQVRCHAQQARYLNGSSRPVSYLRHCRC